ncbi:MAG: glycoside hydrolase family 32 protein [Clostridia bacterium]|nr:glycoside hydrolase family 32 protein [Clostridia bacterium]
MILHIAKRYMLLPVSETARPKTIFLREKGKPVVELRLRLSAGPGFIMPYDLRPFLGRTLEFSVEPGVDFTPVLTDAPEEDGLYREAYRPAAHFTARRGWINDPNGLIWHEGLYHLFFQHNPADTVWGNMHWGHAVSGDLVHWRETSEALWPDESGAMFSGSAVFDKDNLTGLGEKGRAPLLLFYTAAGGHGEMSRGAPFTQRLAYSTDGGETFAKCEKPVIGNIAPGNRDPKVVFCDELNRYVMVLYLEGHAFALFTSENLLDWTLLQRLTIEEDDECPDLYPLSLDGTRWWVLTAAHDRYLIGRFEGGHFVTTRRTGRLHYGRESYAAQTFFSAPDGRRVRIAWNRAPIPGMPFNGSMTTPHDMSLKRLDGELFLCAWPSPEFEALRGEKAEGKDRLMMTGRANDIELAVPASGRRALRLFGLELMIDADAGRVVCPAAGPDGEEASMPVRRADGVIRLRIVQDVHAVELYAGDGEATMCLSHMSDALLNRVECEGASIAAWPLRDIHI